MNDSLSHPIPDEKTPYTPEVQALIASLEKFPDAQRERMTTTLATVFNALSNSNTK